MMKRYAKKTRAFRDGKIYINNPPCLQISAPMLGAQP